MDPLLINRLLDLLINVISIVLGGGLILLLIEWRRHRREKAVWEYEDKKLLIEIWKADLVLREWRVQSWHTDKQKLYIYENELEGSFRELLVYVEFAIRNTTPRDIVVVSHCVQIPSASINESQIQYYDFDTSNLIAQTEIGAINLKPNGSITRKCIVHAEYDKDSRLDEAPKSVRVEAVLSDDTEFRFSATLNLTDQPDYVVTYDNKYHPVAYAMKFEEFVKAQEEDEIPF